jgi:hypothetical protein
MKKILLILLVLIIVAGGVWYFTKDKPIACTEEAKLCSDGTAVGRTGENCEFAECPDEINFSKTGNLIKNNPGLEKDVWYLSYEEPGKPGLLMKLKFAEESICGPEESEFIKCSEFMKSTDLISRRVKITGIILTEDTVALSSLIVLRENFIE